MGKVNNDVFVKYWRGNCPLPSTYPFSGPLGDIQLQHSTYSFSIYASLRMQGCARRVRKDKSFEIRVLSRKTHPLTNNYVTQMKVPFISFQ